jgi:hypothetical protein
VAYHPVGQNGQGACRRSDACYDPVDIPEQNLGGVCAPTIEYDLGVSGATRFDVAGEVLRDMDSGESPAAVDDVRDLTDA